MRNICSWVERTNIIKMIILSNIIYRFDKTTVKIPVACFTERGGKNPRICVKPQRPQIARAILRKKNKARGITHPNFKLYNKATLIKTVWYWHKTRHNRSIEENKKPRSKSMYRCTINLWQKKARNIQWGKNSLFN